MRAILSGPDGYRGADGGCGPEFFHVFVVQRNATCRSFAMNAAAMNAQFSAEWGVPIRPFLQLETIGDFLKFGWVNLASFQGRPGVMLIWVAQAHEQMESTFRIAIADEVFPFRCFFIALALLVAESISANDHRVFFELFLPTKQLQRAFGFLNRERRSLWIDVT